MNTLPDYLRPGLRLLSVGLNPSIPSVKAGFYFANPRNRFWSALDKSRLIDEPVMPGKASIERLFKQHGIGFTDVVKRPTRGAQQLRAADYKQAAPLLLEKIETYQPAVAWFHGKLAWSNFVRYALPEMQANVYEWGEQGEVLAPVHCFITPNPSPANAVYSLDDLVGWFNSLADYAELYN